MWRKKNVISYLFELNTKYEIKTFISSLGEFAVVVGSLGLGAVIRRIPAVRSGGKR
jgi:hypothetical protein